MSYPELVGDVEDIILPLTTFEHVHELEHAMYQPEGTRHLYSVILTDDQSPYCRYVAEINVSHIRKDVDAVQFDASFVRGRGTLSHRLRRLLDAGALTGTVFRTQKVEETDLGYTTLYRPHWTGLIAVAH